MIPISQTPEQLKVRDLKYYLDSRGNKWIQLNRGLTDNFIIKDLIALSERLGVDYKVIPGNTFSTILIDPDVYDEYMSDVSEGE